MTSRKYEFADVFPTENGTTPSEQQNEHITEPAANRREARGEWANPVEFVLSCLGYAVGLGNVWRFPYLCYINGGGAFLIPYYLMLVFVGIPCFMIELTLGQYAAAGPVHVWTISPIFRGIGLGMIIISFIGCIYYNMIIGWSLYYIFASFQKVLPWSHCDHDYNTELCFSKSESEACKAMDKESIYINQQCYSNQTFQDYYNATNTTSDDYIHMCKYLDKDTTYEEAINSTKGDELNSSKPCNYEDYIYDKYYQRVSASEEYFNYGMLERSDSMDEPGGIIWQLALVLLLAWVICYLCVVKGIQSAGKVVYFTATFPYVILLILFFRGVTLEGAGEGIKFYIIPEWEHIAKPKVWADAAGQIFFSLSVGFGGLMTFASYNKYHNNIYRDTLLVSIGNDLTSFFAGFVIFSILGHMAHVLGKDVREVATSGSGLAFIAYPEVVTYLPVSQLWSVLFFLMLLTLGLDSQFAGIENIQTAIVDVVPSWRSKKWLVSAIICVVMYLLGLTMCTHAGFYWLELMSYYSSGWSLILIGLFESAVIAWAYSAKRLMADIQDMVGFRLYPHWWVCWTFITPILLLLILIFNFIEFTPLAVGDYVLPRWAQSLGWCMAVVSVIVIPLVSIWVVYMSFKDPSYDLPIHKRLYKLTQPPDAWTELGERCRNEAKVQTPTSEETPPESAPSYHNAMFTSDTWESVGSPIVSVEGNVATRL